MQSEDIVLQLVKFVSKTGRLPKPNEPGLEHLVQAAVKTLGSSRLPMFLQMKSYVFNFYRFTIENSLYNSTKDGFRILDAGCGKGDSLRDYSKPKNAEVIGVDILLTDVAASKRRWRAADFVVADLEMLPFREDTFDGALSVDVMEHVEDKTFAMGELARVTRKGGFFLGSSTNVLNPILLLDTIFPKLLKALVNRFSNVAELVPRHSRYSPSSLNGALVKAGYKLDHLTLMGTPVFEEKKMPWLSYLWIVFDKLTKKKPLLFLKETMVWQATRT
jgi:ubiquinone/menaquinone biosynthesis C-methylase UbiE